MLRPSPSRLGRTVSLNYTRRARGETNTTKESDSRMSTHKGLSVELSDNLQTDARATLAIGVHTDGERLPTADTLGGRLRTLCERVVSEGEFKGEEGATLLIHAPGDTIGG